MSEKYETAYIEGVMQAKTFIYSVICFDDKYLKKDESGWVYINDAVVRVTANDEEMAIKQAQLAVSNRKSYEVIECNERI